MGETLFPRSCLEFSGKRSTRSLTASSPFSFNRGVHSPRLVFCNQCTCKILSCYFSNPLPSSVPCALWFSWSHLFMPEQHPCILPRPYIPAFNACTNSSFPTIWPAGFSSGLPVFCLFCFCFFSFFPVLWDRELLFSQKDILKHLTTVFCSFVPKYNFPGTLI